MRNLTFVLFLLFASTTLWSQTIKGTYAIKNVQTGMLLRVKDASNKNGTPLVAYDPQNWKCMTWDFNLIKEDTYQLKNLFTGKTFQPKAGQGNYLEEQPLVTRSEIQQYEFQLVGKSNYRIKLKGTELYLTMEDPKGETNSNIILAKRKESNDQLWSIYQQSPTM